jgi:HK97 family phage portal protein
MEPPPLRRPSGAGTAADLRNDVSSAAIRKGDGVWETFTGVTGNGPPGEAAAMRVTTVYACVSLRAGAIAAMPMHIYNRSRDGDLERDVNNPLWWVLNEEFSPRWPASAGWVFLVASKILHGDGFAEILRRPDGAVAGLVPLHPNRVRVIASPDGSRLIYEVQPDSTIQSPDKARAVMRVLDQDDMLHVTGFGFNGLRSLSALRSSLATAGRLAINAQDFSDGFLRNLGRPDYALKAPGNLSDAQFDRLRQMLEQHAGPANSGKPMVLEGGLDIHAITMPLEDMQLLETRKFQVEEICRALGVPPFMVGHTEKTTSWGTGVAAMGAGFVRFNLRDDLNSFQNEINRKFFKTTRKVAEFDTSELERADIGVMMTALRAGVGRAGELPILSLGEARHWLRLPKEYPGGMPQPNPGQSQPGQSQPDQSQPGQPDADPAKDPEKTGKTEGEPT